MNEFMDAKFKELTTIKKYKGRCSINCKRGLWGVYANSEQQAMIEAKHYFVQYWSDGEYI